ncbi:recombinase family protein [Anaeromicropila populeti]|uniref:Site-specific DNA recombinase n=1 Tax=Anaeromicropila populeti TaxID=37658 RepID=A0A1I6JB85_9FIRM|nr:recombinase family protein [Anaeromicropila populeti]SFR76174.1 Site-specific DNA recombinase [Anaeromicropila populeti]
MERRKYYAAIYVRISKDDGDKQESDSIINQKALIRNFLEGKQEIEVVSEWADDGYSGVNFSRPAFQQMMEQVKEGIVDCIVVKDLSRLGRNYIETGRLLEQIFPSFGVRFIAVNDGYDSVEQNIEYNQIMIPFKNLINDSYCRDISIKIRSHLEVKRKSGQCISSFAPYGYKKAPENKNQLVKDPYPAQIVKEIFNYKLNGMNNGAIADKLNQLGVLSPLEYKKWCGSRFTSGFSVYAKSRWSAVEIGRILRDSVYVGELAQGKVTTPNYKVKKRINKKKEDWIRVKNVHEAIVSEESFEIVQKLMLADTRTSPSSKTVYLFSGLLYCGDCKQNMIRKTVSSRGRQYFYYVCSKNKKGGGCFSHRIAEKKLEHSILAVMNLQLKLFLEAEKLTQVQMIVESSRKAITALKIKEKEKQEDLQKWMRLQSGIYEDYVQKILTQEEYVRMKQEYERRTKEAESEIIKAEEEIIQIREKEMKREEWLTEVRTQKKFTTLYRNAITFLIQNIYVYNNSCITVEFRLRDNFNNKA